MKKRLILAITGASGAELGLAVLKALHDQDVEIHLVLSEGAKSVIRSETKYSEEDYYALADHCYSDTDMAACISSGSFPADGMIIAPCSMKTLAGIVHAYDATLSIRAADVTLKERRRLVLVPRETPYSNAHLRNLLTASEDGAVILPPMLSFYAGADTVEKQIDQIVGKILQLFGLEYPGFNPWTGA